MLEDVASLAAFSAEVLTLEADWMCVDHVSVTSVWTWAGCSLSTQFAHLQRGLF